MENFWDYNVWGLINLIFVLLFSMLIANAIKKTVKPLRNSLIPTSVLGGILLLTFSILYEEIFGIPLFNTRFFGGNSEPFNPSTLSSLEVITYHCLALGFIASALKPSERKLTKERNKEIFNSGITTVSTYVLQAFLGLAISLIAALISPYIFRACGIILPFGYGQGTGQALNWGNVYETENGFIGGRSFGLTIAAFGFLSASIGGVISLNILKRKKKIPNIDNEISDKLTLKDIQSAEEISVNGSIDKLTIQFALIFLTYALTFLLLYGLGLLAPSLKATIYGFNFLFGVIIAALVKAVMNFLKKKNIIKKQYVNNFLMDRISGFFFDIMVIAGIAAIRIDIFNRYWVVILILAIVGAVSTYLYNRLVAKTLFSSYSEEQFLVMFGMLTGTASTGIILLRELDKDFSTPAADNLVYQQIPAIVFGFPIMLLAPITPVNPELVLLIMIGFFILLNLILFRSFIFKRKPKQKEE